MLRNREVMPTRTDAPCWLSARQPSRCPCAFPGFRTAASKSLAVSRNESFSTHLICPVAGSYLKLSARPSVSVSNHIRCSCTVCRPAVMALPTESVIAPSRPAASKLRRRDGHRSTALKSVTVRRAMESAVLLLVVVLAQAMRRTLDSGNQVFLVDRIHSSDSDYPSCTSRSPYRLGEERASTTVLPEARRIAAGTRTSKCPSGLWGRATGAEAPNPEVHAGSAQRRVCFRN